MGYLIVLYYKSDYETLSAEKSKTVPIFSSRGFLCSEQLRSELAMYLTIFIRTLNNKNLNKETEQYRERIFT